jgi:Rps23 Pro-64 3,4-dihydroxylase Tpa1-like proline 4-hydroxylase
LCHDDDIHDDNGKGRRFAFIYYLVPDDWDSSDGGNLDLFSCDGMYFFLIESSITNYLFDLIINVENLQPIKIVKSLTPKQNSLLFFEVSDKSFHQVSEVLSQNKTRFSINGWYIS